MSSNFKLMITFIFSAMLFAANLYPQSFKIALSSNSLTPPGIYGTNSLLTLSFAFAYNSYYLNNIYYASYPVYSRNLDLFARFETNAQGTKLIIRKASDGSFQKEYDILGFNPQWIGNTGNLYYEKPPAGGVNECRSIDVNTGADTKIGELAGQYYPASDPGLGAGALSSDGKKIAYLKGLSIYIYDIATGTEKPLVKPDENNIVDDSLELKVKLAAGPTYPLTIRHLSWSGDGEYIACFGTVSFQRKYPGDTTKYYTLGKQGILVAKTSTGEVRTIYSPANYSIEHPERFFFSPTGTLAFNVIVNNSWHIFMAKPDQSYSARDRGKGYIIAGDPSKQYWALNPWSSSGGRLLYQNEEDGTLGYTRECLDGQIIMKKDLKKISIQDVQWADVIASKSKYTLNIVDINSKPIGERTFVLYINGCKIDTFSTDLNGKYSLSAYAEDTIKIEHYPAYRTAVKAGHEKCNGDTMSYIILDNGKFDGSGNLSYFELGADLSPKIIMDHTTLKFSLIVSIEWDAKREYMDSLASWCRELCNYYYDVTDGQLCFHQIDIYDNAQKWDECDIRIFANNVFTPNSVANGILSNNTNHLINYPRLWYGNYNANKTITAQNNWLTLNIDYQWRTLAHELGHYMLSFYDEYIYFNADGTTNNGRAIPGNYNFGYMDSQYPSGGDWSSEMSNSKRYTNNSYRITKQWFKNGKDCWSDFESAYERTYNGVFCPIIKPSERVIAGGLDFFPGPDINVGKELKTNIYDNNNGAGDYNLIVKDASGNRLNNTNISLYKPKTTLYEGMNAFDGSFKVIGANADDKLKMTDVDRRAGTTYTKIDTIRSVSFAKQNKDIPLEDTPIEIIMTKVNGSFNQVNTWEFDVDSVLNFKSFVNKKFSADPSFEIPKGLDPPDQKELTFVTNTISYVSRLDTVISPRGIFLINASDDSQESFSIPISYLITGYNPMLAGPEGDVEILFGNDSNNISKLAILTCGFHTSRNGLDTGAEQSGNVHSITCIPNPVSTENPVILEIGYNPDDLFNKPQEWLRIFKWDTTALQWSVIGGIVDTLEHIVSSQIESTGTFALFTVNNPVNVDEGMMYDNRIELAPIPCDDKVTLSYSNIKDEVVTISIFNLFGSPADFEPKSLYWERGFHKLEIKTSNLSPGVYFIIIKTDKKSRLLKFEVIR